MRPCPLLLLIFPPSLSPAAPAAVLPLCAARGRRALHPPVAPTAGLWPCGGRCLLPRWPHAHARRAARRSCSLLRPCRPSCPFLALPFSACLFFCSPASLLKH